MADATEDDLLSSSYAPAMSDSEDDDLPPDFLNFQTGKSKSGIPKRGEKDFESNTTQLQSRTLVASRNAMWDTLDTLRVHHTATFERRRVKTPATQEGDKGSVVDQDESTFSIVESGGTPIGIFDPITGLTTVEKQHVRTTLFSGVGKNLSGGDVELLPEEALYALEGSKLDVRYPDSFWNHRSEVVEDDNNEPLPSMGMPMSLQGAYAAYIGEETSRGGKLTLEKYLVYASLKRQGFMVQRAENWEPPSDQFGNLDDPPKPRGKDGITGQSYWQHLISRLVSSTLTAESESTAARYERQRLGPLVRPGIYRSYADIFRLLKIFTSANPLVTTRAADPVAATLLNAPFLTMTPATPNHSRQSSRPTNIAPSAGNLSPTSLSPTASVRKLPTNFKPERLPAPPPTRPTPYVTHWNVYKPVGNTGTNNTSSENKKAKAKMWKKSSPGPPDFRICVVSARDTKVPTLLEMEAIWSEQPLTPPHARQKPEESKDTEGLGSASTRSEGIGAVYARLRHGYRNVILAIVDEGVVSFVRMADPGFGGEKLFDRIEGGGRGGKNSGRGGNRGRGGRNTGSNRGR